MRRTHVIPRNPAIPDMSLREVVSSEPIMRNAQGQVVGNPIPLYRGNSPKLSVISMYSPGTYYNFELGWLYVMQGPNSPSEWLFGAAKEGAMFAAPGLAELAGPFSRIVEEAMHAVLEEIPTDRSEGKKGALKRAAATALERLAPLVPAYEKIPVMSEALGVLRGVVAGKGEAAAS